MPQAVPPPSWSVVVGDLGSISIALTGAFFLAALLFSILESRFPKLARYQTVAMWLGSLGFFTSFGCLASLLLNQRFEWKYVQAHSDLLTPLEYRFAAVWSGQEGSFLLWGTMSAIFTLFAMRGAGAYKRAFIGVSAAFLACIAGILVYETPFTLFTMHGKPGGLPDGTGLAPSLLNYWVIIHPPTIFLGFGSLLVMFAYSVAAILHRDPVSWIPQVRPYALVSLALLGLGLCMGGFWAYETLGWGGFWMWDPVENTSFVPWCLLVAFVHGILVQNAKGRWVAGNLLMGAVPFLSFVYGTFLTRSGFLGDTSVHSFANMNRGALWILMGIGAVGIFGFLTLWGTKGLMLAKAHAKPRTDTEGFAREDAYRFGNLTLILFAIMTGAGMSWPMISKEIMRINQAVVTEWQYHQILPYPFFATMILMAVAPFIGWRKADWKSVGGKMYVVVCFAIALAGAVMLVIGRTEWAGFIESKDTVNFFFGAVKVQKIPWTLVLAGMCFLVLVANVIRFVETFKRSKMGGWGFMSHIGVAILMAGLVLSRGLEQKADFVVQEGGMNTALGYIIAGKRHTNEDITNRGNKVLFDVERNGKVEEFAPGLYLQNIQEGRPVYMVWPFIRRHLLFDTYFTLHSMELDATAPETMKPGETKQFDRFQVTYRKLTRDGEPGKEGTKFGADLKIVDVETHETYEVNPGWVLAKQGVEVDPAVFGDFFLTVQGMDAATQSFTFQLHFKKPLYPVEIFVKPFTGLVWFGTGILTLAVLMTAVARRRPSAPDPAPAPSDADASTTPPEDHALTASP